MGKSASVILFPPPPVKPELDIHLIWLDIRPCNWTGEILSSRKPQANPTATTLVDLFLNKMLRTRGFNETNHLKLDRE